MQDRSPLSLLESMQTIDDRLCGSMVPVQETKDHRNMVYYKDLLSLSEDNCVSIEEALDMAIKENCIPRKGLVVAIEEWRPLCNPEIMNQFSDIVLVKESIYSEPYRICDKILSNYLESGENPFWLDVLEEACLNEEFAMSILEAGEIPPQPTQQNLNRIKNARKLRTGVTGKIDTVSQEKLNNAPNRSAAAPKPAQPNSAPNPNQNNTNNPQQQSWVSRMWSSIKNWWSNNFGDKGNANTPTNQYAQAGANWANDQASTWLDRGAAWLSNWLQSKGADFDIPVGLARDAVAEKIPELVNKGANYVQKKMS